MIRRMLPTLPLAVVLLDLTAVAVLLPDIRLDLGSSPSGGQWVLNAYLLSLAALFPLLAPLRGRALTIAGALAMAAGAIVCARAGSTAVLMTGQAIQGAGAAALLAPLTGGWSAMVLPAAALALGPAVGGVFAEQNWWHVFFWAGVPLAALAGAGALAAPPTARPQTASPMRLGTFVVGLTAFTVVLVQAEPWSLGWASLPLVFGLVGIIGGVRKLPGSLVAWAALAGCLTALLFLIPEYLQLVRNLSGLRTGILLVAVTLPAVTGWAVAGWLATRISLAVIGLAGVACGVAGLAALAAIDVDTRYAILIGALGLTGTGVGAAAASLPRTESRALAAALVGAGAGLAVGGAAFQVEQADQRGSGASFEHALAAGFGWAAVMLIALLALATISVWRDRAARGRPTPASSAARPAAES